VSGAMDDAFDTTHGDLSPDWPYDPPAPAAARETPVGAPATAVDWHGRMYRQFPSMVLATHLPEKCPMCLLAVAQGELDKARRIVRSLVGVDECTVSGCGPDEICEDCSRKLEELLDWASEGAKPAGTSPLACQEGR
jgi:hypothetical protein